MNSIDCENWTFFWEGMQRFVEELNTEDDYEDKKKKDQAKTSGKNNAGNKKSSLQKRGPQVPRN
jgi:hypothetical protein